MNPETEEGRGDELDFVSSFEPEVGRGISAPNSGALTQTRVRDRPHIHAVAESILAQGQLSHFANAVELAEKYERYIVDEVCRIALHVVAMYPGDMSGNTRGYSACVFSAIPWLMPRT